VGSRCAGRLERGRIPRAPGGVRHQPGNGEL